MEPPLPEPRFFLAPSPATCQGGGGESLAWTYSDWVTYDISTDGTTRLSQLRLHMQEVSDKIEKERTAGGRTSSSHALERYLEGLKEDEKTLAKALGVDIPNANEQAMFTYNAFRNKSRSTEG